MPFFHEIIFKFNYSFLSRPEIIEFPAVLLKTQKLEITDEFKSYCRPVINPLLTEFCTELTGITQVNYRKKLFWITFLITILKLFPKEDVDKAPLFHEVLSSFEEWLEKHKLGTKYSFAIVTDGPWDLGKFLKDQCMVRLWRVWSLFIRTNVDFYILVVWSGLSSLLQLLDKYQENIF